MAEEQGDALDAVGAILCRLGHKEVNASWHAPVCPVSGFYALDWRDDQRRFFSGTGPSLSAAETNAIARHEKHERFTAVAGGFAVDADAC